MLGKPKKKTIPYAVGRRAAQRSANKELCAAPTALIAFNKPTQGSRPAPNHSALRAALCTGSEHGRTIFCTWEPTLGLQSACSPMKTETSRPWSFCFAPNSQARPVKLAFRWRPQLPDPDDDMVLETAVNGNADAIVTFNQMIFSLAARPFNCAVVLPGEALRQLRRVP